MVLSLGTRSAVSDVEPIAPGVQVQVALPTLEATAEHPGIVDPPDLKVTVPFWETVAVILIAAPLGTEVTPSVSARVMVGVTCATVMEIALRPERLDASVATTLDEYVPAASVDEVVTTPVVALMATPEIVGEREKV